MVEGLAAEENLARLATVETVGVRHALVEEGLGEAVHGPGRSALRRVIEGHVVIMQMIDLPDPGTGIALGGLAGGIPVTGLEHPVLHQHGAEGEREEDVVVEQVLFHLGAAALLKAVGEVEVAGGVDEAGVDAVVLLVLPGVGAVVHTPELPVIDHGPKVAEHIEIRIHGDDRVHCGSEFRSVEPDRGAERILGDFAPELRGVRDLDLAAGAGAPVDDLFPENHQDRLVVVITDKGVVIEFDVRVKDQVLPLQQPGLARLLNDGEDLVRLVERERAEGPLVGDRSRGCVLRDHVMLLDRGDAAESVGLGVCERVLEPRSEVGRGEARRGGRLHARVEVLPELDEQGQAHEGEDQA